MLNTIQKTTAIGWVELHAGMTVTAVMHRYTTAMLLTPTMMTAELL